MRYHRLIPALAVLALSVAGCGSAPLQPAPAETAAASFLEQDYRQLSHESGARVFVLDPDASRIRIYAFRGGAAAFAGHNHVIGAAGYGGFVYLPGGKVSGARVDLQFPLAQLLVDDPDARRQTGGAFEGTLDAAAIAGTRAHMLSADNLDAAHFPELRIHSLSIAGDWPRAVATVAVTLHGQTQQLRVPLQATLDRDRLQVSGALALRQSDFGVRPYSALGGLLKVQDDVAIDFTLVGKPAVFQ